MRLFVVTSVYQFLNALTVQMNDPSVPSDILCVLKLLDDTFDLEALRKEGVFQDVYVWTGDICSFRMVSKTKVEKLTNAIKKVRLALGKKRLQKQMPKSGKHYDEIFLAYPDYPSRLAFETLRDKDTRCAFLEDGAYTYEVFSKKQSRLKSLAFRLLLGSDVVNLVSLIYVYRPEILCLPKKQAKVMRITSELKKTGPIIKRIYKHELPNADLIDRFAIMFDQDIEEPITASQQANMANICANTIGKENFVVKIHPRSLFSTYSNQVDICREKCPFEILMSTMQIQNKVLISLFSTACMTPKMMLDLEPVVIFTAKLSGMQEFSLPSNKTLELIERFRESYRDPSRVYIPETMDEFQAIINKYKLKFDESSFEE